MTGRLSSPLTLTHSRRNSQVSYSPAYYQLIPTREHTSRTPPTTLQHKMSVYLSPPRSGVATHPSTPHSANPAAQPATPVSEMTLPTSIFPPPSFPQPEPAHLQRDLLVLTSFNDNTTLRWRPSWFPALISPLELWSLHNPPDVVTEPLPKVRGGIQHFTRRMRRPSDPAPRYIKTWLHWHQYCKLYSIPVDFLSEEHVKVLQMGLVRDAEGVVCGEFCLCLHLHTR